MPDLIVCDGSRFVTSSAENPNLTIVAPALHPAEQVADLLA